MTLEEDLKSSGARIAGSGGTIDVRHLTTRVRRGQITLRLAVAAVVVAVSGIAVRATVDREGESGTDVEVGRSDLAAPRGSPVVRSSDGRELNELTATPDVLEDPVSARVADELIHDPDISAALERLGVRGSAAERLAAVMSRRLVIDTSVDAQLQAAAARSAADGARREGVDVALVAIDFRSGEITAMAGPATQVREIAGTALLPVVMLAALEAGISPDERVPAPASLTVDVPEHGEWTVSNFDARDLGSVTLAEAVANAAQTPWVRLFSDGRLRPADVVEAGDALGLPSLPANPSTLLGAADVSIIDLATAYATITNLGERSKAHVVRRISLPDGSVVFEAATRSKPRQVTERAHAAAVRAALGPSSCCGQAADTAGVGQGGRIGVAGVLQDFRASWFGGSIPAVTAVVWSGSADGSRDTARVPSPVSAAIWRDFMDDAATVLSAQAFPQP